VRIGAVNDDRPRDAVLANVLSEFCEVGFG
jgi:hypothetical protein